MKQRSPALKTDSHQQLIHQIVIEALTMTIKEQLLQEIEKAPEPLLQEVLNFIQFLQSKRLQEKLEITLLS